MPRPSRYLVEKVEVFQKLINFWKQDEQRAIFLSQIDFWEWELENIIFSFQNFEERSKIWKDRNLEEVLRAKGFILRNSKSQTFKIAARGNHVNQVVAPWSDLNKLIYEWNHLLDNCQTSLLVDESKLEQFGVNKVSLSKFKKNEH